MNARNVIRMVAAAVLLAAGVPGEAAAAVVLISRTSQTEIDGGANSDAGGWAYHPLPVTTTDLYAEFISSQTDSADSFTGGYHAESYADQVSSLLSGESGVLVRASASGLVSAETVIPPPPPPGGASATADSFFDIFFDVTVDPVPFTLTGGLSSEGGDPGTVAEVTLDRIDAGAPGGRISIVSWQTAGDSFPHSLPFSDSGILEPGSYELRVSAFADGPFNATSVASYSATLTVPEPATLALLAAGGLSLIRRKRR